LRHVLQWQKWLIEVSEPGHPQATIYLFPDTNFSHYFLTHRRSMQISKNFLSAPGPLLAELINKKTHTSLSAKNKKSYGRLYRRDGANDKTVHAVQRDTNFITLPRVCCDGGGGGSR
jgi:hypothetical protein